MKKSTKLLVVVLCLAVVFGMFVLTACGDKETNDVEKTVTIVIGEDDPQVITVTTGAKYLFDAINELSNKETEPLHINGVWGAYGLYVTEIGGLSANAAIFEYIAVLTSDTENQVFVRDEYTVTKEYGGKECVSANFGVSSLPLKDGEIYMFLIR